MPINKPTIAHQLKTVKINKPKTSSVIHTNSNIVATTPHTRSHLRSGGLQWRKSSYDRREDVVDPGDISHLELKQCTRILRNVLANEENKSTSTEDGVFDNKFGTLTLIGSKSPDISHSTERQNCLKNIPTSGDLLDELTEADSLSSIVDPKPNLTSTTKLTTPESKIRDQVCTCQVDLNGKMHDSKKLTASGDSVRINGDKSLICARCHKIIPHHDHIDKDITQGSVKGRDHDNTKTYIVNGNTDYISSVHSENIGDEKIDNLVGYLQMKVNEIGIIARTTRDADLDRLVSEIDRAFQQMVRENALVFNHLKTITKTLKWDNSGLKQKIKIQSDTIRDLKSEIKLLRQEHRQKLEELKLEMQLKVDEVRLLTEKDKTSVTIWSDKYHNLEKNHEKLRCECQSLMLQNCQKDTEITQLKHTSAQSDSKLKEQIYSLTMVKQALQTDLSKAQELNKKFDHECQHNQSIIKSAREHVINLLDRHKQARDGASSIGYRFDSVCDTPQNGSGDWINQATSLQQVLSMVSDQRDGQKILVNDNGHNMTSTAYYNSVPTRLYDQSHSMTVSPINFATTNYNNNYVSSSICNPTIQDLSRRISDNDATQAQLAGSYHDHRSLSRSPSEVSSTISRNSFSYSQRQISGQLPDDMDEPIKKFNDKVDDSWHHNIPKAKLSGSSSVLSTVSSLRSTDDRDFRSGMQRLDSQISRLQTTLQSKLVCK